MRIPPYLRGEIEAACAYLETLSRGGHLSAGRIAENLRFAVHLTEQGGIRPGAAPGEPAAPAAPDEPFRDEAFDELADDAEREDDAERDDEYEEREDAAA
jgi:hypothetical protein